MNGSFGYLASLILGESRPLSCGGHGYLARTLRLAGFHCRLFLLSLSSGLLLLGRLVAGCGSGVSL